MDKELKVEVNIPESFIQNIKCGYALSEYNDWVEYLKKELENLYSDILRNGITEEP